MGLLEQAHNAIDMAKNKLNSLKRRMDDLNNLYSSVQSDEERELLNQRAQQLGKEYNEAADDLAEKEKEFMDEMIKEKEIKDDMTAKTIDDITNAETIQQLQDAKNAYIKRKQTESIQKSLDDVLLRTGPKPEIKPMSMEEKFREIQQKANEETEEQNNIYPEQVASPVEPAGPVQGGYYVHFDAPPGKLEAKSFGAEIAVNDIWPKLKHGFYVEFSAPLSGLGWLVKTIDRPKPEVEYTDQIRNNALRHYMIKYSYGDINVTFWDDRKNAAVQALTALYYDKVLSHGSVSAGAEPLLRDSVMMANIVLEQFNIYPEPNLVFVYENVLVTSIEFDQNDADDDSGSPTLAATFKYEKFSVH